MKSRMDKYQKTSNDFERTKKNSKLYDDIYESIYKDATYENMEVIDKVKEINVDKLKSILDDKYETRQYRTFRQYVQEDFDNDFKVKKEHKNKIYDINEIITNAKNKRAFIEETREKQKYIDYKNSKYYSKIKKDDDINEDKEEKKLIDMIEKETSNNINNETSSALDIFYELKGSENTIVTKPIDSDVGKEIAYDNTTQNLDKTLIKADKTFYTDSNMFTKNDFEDFSTLSRKMYKSSKKKKVIIIFLIMLLVIAGFLYYKFYK